MGAELIRTGRVALFLDGLDEMPPAVQGTALQVIDRDAAGLRVVLTSRSEQYRAAVEQGRLYGAAVIDVLPVAPDQAQAFLLAEQLSDRRRQWQQITDHLHADPDSAAARALTSPLALALARDTYTHADPTDLLDTRTHPTPPRPSCGTCSPASSPSPTPILPNTGTPPGGCPGSPNACTPAATYAGGTSPPGPPAGNAGS